MGTVTKSEVKLESNQDHRFREPSDKIALLHKIAAALNATGDPELRWAANGVLRCVQRGGSLDAGLGLKPRQGGRFETPRALNDSTIRNEMLHKLAHCVSGSMTAKARTLAEWFAEGGPPAGNIEAGEKYRDLLKLFPTINLRDRQIARVLNHETVAARRHHSRV